MSWASDKARELIANSQVELGPRGRSLVERAIRETLAEAEKRARAVALNPETAAAAIRKLGEP